MTGPHADLVLTRAPALAADLPAWISGLPEDELKKVWVSAIVSTVLESALSGEEGSLADLSRALVAIRDRVASYSPPRAAAPVVTFPRSMKTRAAEIEDRIAAAADHVCRILPADGEPVAIHKAVRGMGSLSNYTYELVQAIRSRGAVVGYGRCGSSKRALVARAGNVGA